MILRVLRDNPEMSLVEVASVIEKSISAVERASSKLVKQGVLMYIGSKKDGHWEILE